ncbi:hypothetical protein NDU88_002948 [Pleurodeles waltl]|uniref:Uncharacterized protein n=1 Tax=Pleurodeles waltl TaxID=8319 RepID=A0AAV7W4T0_PLEWA|nr:hypothetical protein NDU88_002948 [Pleurodeles waltl]
MHIVSESLAGVMPVRALEDFDSFLVSKKSVILVLPASLDTRHRASDAEAPQAPALQALAEPAGAGCRLEAAARSDQAQTAQTPAPGPRIAGLPGR